MLHVDWEEQHKVTEIREVQSAYFNGRYSSPKFGILHQNSLKIHEVLIEKNLEIKKKNLPTNAFFKGVLLKESRRRSTVRNDSDSEYEDIVDSDY